MRATSVRPSLIATLCYAARAVRSMTFVHIAQSAVAYAYGAVSGPNRHTDRLYIGLALAILFLNGPPGGAHGHRDHDRTRRREGLDRVRARSARHRAGFDGAGSQREL